MGRPPSFLSSSANNNSHCHKTYHRTRNNAQHLPFSSSVFFTWTQISSIAKVLVVIVLLISCQKKVDADSLTRNLSHIGNSSNTDIGDYEDNDELQFNLIGKDEVRQDYSHQWAAHIVGGKAVAERIARKHGFINAGEIFPDYYHLVHRKVAKRSVEAHGEVHRRLTKEPVVRWAEQQKVKRRSKRDLIELSPPPSSSGGSISGGGRNGGGKKSRAARRSKAFNLNDPRWPQMWYLNRGAGLDMNVIESWNEGITGKGIVVTILDDGLEKDHPDILRNYDPMASFDVNNLDMDPMPTYDLTDSNRHGTRCAGEVAAEANNSICAVGIAYEAGVGGVRMLDGDVTDAVEARSLSHNPQHIDIYSASWGPDDDGKTVDGPGELATRAFMEGVAKGRNGKGSIFVWASGNGGRDHDNCNCDGYTNSIWTLSISSATENGLVPWYSEACSSTLATTYSSGGTGEKQVVTIDLHHSCTQSHTGTSASAPLAAGICALALHANKNLTWRDMQHIVVRTARPNNLIAPDWATNGVGRNVSHSFGYGLMDAGAMVKLAKKWETVPEQHKCEIKAPYTEKNIPAKSKVTLDLKVTDCPHVQYLEHVQAKVTLMSGRRGDLQIYLVSPTGTRSVLLAHRRHDLNRNGFTDWPFMTVHNWGESPLGKWTLEIHNEGRYTDHKNGRTVLKRWSLVAYGTEEDVNSEEYRKNKERSSSSSKSFQQQPNSPKSPFATISLNLSSSDNQKFPPKNIITKSGSKIVGEGSDSRITTLHSNATSSSEASSISNRKPSRQRQNKGKNVSKKQKVATSVPPASKTLEGTHTIVTTSDDEEFKRFLKLNFNLNLNQSIASDATNHTFTNHSLTGPPTAPNLPSSSNSSLPIKMEQNRSVGNANARNNNDSLQQQTEKAGYYSTTVSSVNESQNMTGELKTWSLIAHGLESNPNDKKIGEQPTGNRKPNIDQNTDSKLPSNFDGSDNTVSVQFNHVHNPSLPENSEIAADSSLSISSTSVASSPSSSNCAKKSADGTCLECVAGFALYQKDCVTSCPRNGYFVTKGISSFTRDRTSLLSYLCVPCHYSCLACFGPEAHECLSCHNDSKLITNTEGESQSYSLCYPEEFQNFEDNNGLWYKLLIFSVLVNLVVIFYLIFVTCCQRGNSNSVSRREGQMYTRISPEDDQLPSGDEFENLEMDSETDEFSITTSTNSNNEAHKSEASIGENIESFKISSNYKNNISTFSMSSLPMSQIATSSKDSNNKQDDILIESGESNKKVFHPNL